MTASPPLETPLVTILAVMMVYRRQMHIVGLRSARGHQHRVIDLVRQKIGLQFFALPGDR